MNGYRRHPGAVDAPIRSLSGTPTHQLAVLVYQAHRDAGNGFCARCGHRVPCVASRNAGTVITAAGDDVRRYDAPPARASPLAEPPARHTGYREHPGAAGYVYEREPE